MILFSAKSIMIVLNIITLNKEIFITFIFGTALLIFEVGSQIQFHVSISYPSGSSE